MNTRVIVIMLVLTLLSTACGQQPATLPHTLDVPANRRWVKTNVCLEAGQSIQITARGEIYLEGNRYKNTPNGSGSCEGAAWGPCSLVGAGWGTLLGRIGDDSPFVIGSSSQITATEVGCLQLGINDTNSDDNSGSYTVAITQASTSRVTQEIPATSIASPTTTPALTFTPTPISTFKFTPALTPTLTPPSTSLRSLAQVRSLWIGAAVAVGPLLDEVLYARTLAREFNMLTPENAMKFGPVHPDLDRYNFDAADTIVDFAEENDMQVRGHTLVWHSQLPSWLTEGNWTREELIQILQEHIMTVVGHYRGRVLAWDVINEAVADNGRLRETIWLNGIGPEYIDMAFQWAHEADPGALLFYNDYSGEGLGAKSDAIYALTQGLLQRGVPIHGVGLQMHVSVDSFPRPQDVAVNMERLSALGLEVHITEMDVRIQDPATEEDLIRQASVYRDVFHVCQSVQNCKAFVLWGFTDLHSWISSHIGGWDTALIFDKVYRPKPAYNALIDELSDH